MKAAKTQLCRLENCYAVSVMHWDGTPWYVAASEGRQPCYAFPAEDMTRRETLWDQPGGCMTMVQIPDGSGEFLAIQRFYSLFQWEGAQVVWIYRDASGEVRRKVLAQLPYIHRIDVLRDGERLYFVGCSVAQHKDTLEDWRTGGRIYVAELQPGARRLEGLQLLRDDLFQNHGYCHQRDTEGEYGLIGCAQGVFRIRPQGGRWSLTRIFDKPVSDMALADIDGDGVAELATIEPFHGLYFRVYRQTDQGWRQIFQHPETTEFYHVAWGGSLNGRPCFIGGCRRGKKQLFVLTGSPQGAVEIHLLDQGAGPSNVAVCHSPQGDCILSANRERGEAAVYRILEI